MDLYLQLMNGMTNLFLFTYLFQRCLQTSSKTKNPKEGFENIICNIIIYVYFFPIFTGLLPNQWYSTFAEHQNHLERF